MTSTCWFRKVGEVLYGLDLIASPLSTHCNGDILQLDVQAYNVVVYNTEPWHGVPTAERLEGEQLVTTELYRPIYYIENIDSNVSIKLLT